VGYAKRSELEMVSLESAQDEMVRRGKIAEELIALQRPDLINLFLTYQNEAIAARKFLNESLNELDAGAEILEVGGGILALAIQLASEGFRITTVEPVGEGFKDISIIMKIFSEIARRENLTFELVESPIEVCSFDHKFDFIFSINVMEHLKDPYLVLLQMVQSLKPSGNYRFFCPNYDFPYEPHFGKWLFVRKDKAFFLPEKRAKSNLISIEETSGLYLSLNFLTLRKLKTFAIGNKILLEPNQYVLSEMFSRSSYDPELKKRHPGITHISRIICLLNLDNFAKLTPTNFQPIMDIKASFSRL
jgi:2-polyprenyl-3-methyl-5-hydroxy-6-metoxy-1,4-benzoquinol methylase